MPRSQSAQRRLAQCGVKLPRRRRIIVNTPFVEELKELLHEANIEFEEKYL